MIVYKLKTIRLNRKDEDFTYKINDLWSLCHAQYSQLREDSYYGIYHNYSGLENEYFDFTIASKQPLTNDTMNLEGKNMKIYLCQGSNFKCVTSSWQKILRDERESKVKRKYELDYEFYKKNGHIYIYVGLLK